MRNLGAVLEDGKCYGKGKVRDLKGILSVGRAVLNTGVGLSSLRRTCSW